MAKNFAGKTQEKKTSNYPSEFGSHQSMVDEELTSQIDDRFAILRDDHGPYVTEKKRLDSGMADPNRYLSAQGRKEQLKEYLGEVPK